MYKSTEQLVAAVSVLLLTNCICPLHSLNVEQFTEDMMEYFGVEDPVVLFDPLVVTTPLSLGMTTSFIVIEYDTEEPGAEAEIYKVISDICFL